MLLLLPDEGLHAPAPAERGHFFLKKGESGGHPQTPGRGRGPLHLWSDGFPVFSRNRGTAPSDAPRPLAGDVGACSSGARSFLFSQGIGELTRATSPDPWQGTWSPAPLERGVSCFLKESGNCPERRPQTPGRGRDPLHLWSDGF